MPYGYKMEREKDLHFSVFVYNISIPKQDRVAYKKVRNLVYTLSGSTGKL